MDMIRPYFNVSNEMLNLVAEISEQIEVLSDGAACSSCSLVIGAFAPRYFGSVLLALFSFVSIISPSLSPLCCK